MPLTDEFKKVLTKSWEIMDRTIRYPIINRGLACFFSTELEVHFNAFREIKIKDASVIEVYEHLEEVFADLEISSEYLEPANKRFLLAAFASLLGDVTIYKNSENTVDVEVENFRYIIGQAERFAHFGTGSCAQIVFLMYFLLSESITRPLEIFSLDSTLGDSGHCLILVDRDIEVPLANIYESNVFVIDYWSGCTGIARELFKEDGPLASFKDRVVTRHVTLDKNSPALPGFVFPKIEDCNNLDTLIELYYQKFIAVMQQKIPQKKQPSPLPLSFFLEKKYQIKAAGINFHELRSSYCNPSYGF